MSLESFGLVASGLRARGFKQVRAQHAGAKAFRGELVCRGNAVTVRLEIADWDFVSYPRIFLESVPDVLAGFRPHVLSGGDLCYYTKGAIVLNRFKPAEAVARCLQRAQETLEEVSAGREFRFGIQDEFGYYWNEGSFCAGSIDAKKRRARLVCVDAGTRSWFVLTQTGDEPEWLARATGGSIKPQFEIPVWLIETEQQPSVAAQGGLPKTIKQTMDWVKQWDPVSLQRLTRLLEGKDYLDHGIVSFVFCSPVGLFGFFLELDATHRKAYRRKPLLYRQYLHSRGAQTPVTRIYAVDISPEFVHVRNIQGTSLLGRKVTMIGCGAIGGYLAHCLIRLGAGVGASGRLTLIDYDSMQAGNLGRHVLGFPALSLPKAVALREEMTRQFPYAQLRALEKDAREHLTLFTDDLIVDATGEETLSIALAGMHHERLRANGAPPLLHAWVAGNGDAVQALFVDGKKGGCYRCMWVDDPDKGMTERIALLKKPPATRFVGCQSVTMFPVSAAMSAAALASDIVIDWLAGDPSPRFRTRTRENVEAFRAKNQNLTKLESCPACNRT
jgi:molybdopterin/thiamine biosynthesis adenylyltransferase